MKKVASILVVTLLLVLCAGSALAQKHPLPKSDKESPAVCTGCGGNNSAGQSNDGLPTWSYPSSPLNKFVGRVVDSTSTQDYQNIGMRTARAERIVIARNQRGTAPPRVYMRLGSTLAAYTLDTFFTSKLPGGTSPVSSINTGWPFNGHDPLERVLTPDAFVYPESSRSGWTTSVTDGQDRLGEWDYDDRGYLYIGYSSFGWGIVQDKGETGGKQLALVKQVFFDNKEINPWMAFVLKTGGKYYAVVSNQYSNTTHSHAVYDVTNPTAPDLKFIVEGAAEGISAFAKDDANQRLAIINRAGHIAIYDYSDFVTSRNPITTFAPGTGKKWTGITADDSGNFWAVEGDKVDNNVITRLTASGSTYRKDTFNDYPQPFGAETVSWNDKFLAVGGRITTAYGKGSNTVFIYKVTSTGLDLIDTKSHFTNYYHSAPEGYAQPQRPCPIRDAHVMKWGGKTYVLYNADSLGDVYEITTGDTISASLKSTTNFGTKNPNSKQTANGPFYGDILTFKSISSNASWDYNVEWNFGNPEAGSDNVKLSKTGNEVSYQYSGLTTSAKITAQKTVSVEVTNDSSMADTVKVDMSVPSPRIGLKGVSSFVVTGNNAAFEVVAGDEFTDASDGVVEGHTATWNIGTDTATLRPNETKPVGDVGPHTLNFVGKYGRYDANLASIGTPYEAKLSNIDYVVRPFDIELKAPTKGSSNYTFAGDARVSSVNGMVTATNWTVTWTLKNAAGADIVPPQVDSKPVGTLTTLVVPTTTTIPSGSVLTLKVEVAPSEVNATSEYAVDTDEMTLATPDPLLSPASLACNTGSPCSLSVVRTSGGAVPSDWAYKWTVKNGGATVSVPSTTSNPLSFTPSAPGSYTATVDVTQGIFTETRSKSFTVEGPVCGPPPTEAEVSIHASCSANCPSGTAITFEADLYHYEDQPCNEYKWSFGDNSTGTGKIVTHSYSSSRTYTVSLTVKTSSGASSGPITKTITVGSGSPPPPPPTDCTKPTGLLVEYSGKNGCKAGVACTTSEAVRFSLYRGNGTELLQACDEVSWNFDDGTAASTAKGPSHTFTAPGTYDVVVTVTNSKGSGTATARVVVTSGSTGGCASLTGKTVYYSYKGASTGCKANGADCAPGEEVQFTALGWNYEFQNCDKFEWDFDDGSALVTEMNPKHVFSGSKSSYNVKLRVWNTTTPNGLTITDEVKMGVPAKPVPVLTFGTTFPKTGAKDREITFNVTSNLDLTTGWKWTFNNTADNSQATVISKTNSIKHTFTAVGTYTVKVTARNAEDSASAPTGSVQDTITITDEPEAVYLLPVVAHIGGQNNSSWRTDLQIYNPDPNASESNPLIMSAAFNGEEKNLYVLTSTYIREDFMTFFTNGNASGPVIMKTKAKYPPQIWTRTYNQTENGTYGQFIPAIRIDNGGGSASLDGKYYLAGLHQNSDFRTNLGFVNPTAAPITATITAYDDERVRLGQMTQSIGAYQLVQFPISNIPGVASAAGALSVDIDIPAGQWIIAYASLIDGKSSDPVFIQAMRETDLASADYQSTVIPGVGHITQADGSWRSDVTIFNPFSEGVQLTLEYYNNAGSKLAEGAVTIRTREFIQYSDLLKQGVLGDVPEGLGMLRIKTNNIIHDGTSRYPMTFARTYFDRGNIGTFGQGIGGFSAARANVKPGKKALIPGVRSNGDYYTNIGLTNVGDVPASVTVTLLDPSTGGPGPQMTYPLQPNQSVIGRFDFGIFEAGTMIVETNAGSVWAFASVIDTHTKDPEYVPAIPLP